MEEKTRLTVIISMLLLVFVLGVVLGNSIRIEKAILPSAFSPSLSLSPPTNGSANYSYTKAICSGNKCIDILVVCEAGKVAKLEPMSDLVELSNTSGVNVSEQLCN